MLGCRDATPVTRYAPSPTASFITSSIAATTAKRCSTATETIDAFLKAMADLKERMPFDLYGYCLMSNHIHLLVRPRKLSISRIVQSLLVSHTQRFHRFHRSGGHVWQGRFKSPVIQDDDHLLTVLRYIEANPLRAGMVERAGDYPWSSFACHGEGRNDPLLDAVASYEALATYAAVRQRRWSAYVHAQPEEAETAAIRRSSATGLPYGKLVGSTAWRLD